MRIVVVIPLIEETDPVIEYTCHWLAHIAIAENYAITEMAGNVKEALRENTICFIFDKPKNTLVKTAWLSFQLPSIIKKLGADVVLQLAGTASNKISVPQVLLIPSAEYLSLRKFPFTWIGFFKTELFKKIPSAKYVVSTSAETTKLLRKEYDAKPDQLKTILLLPYKQITELSWHETESIKRELTGGAEFFYTDASFVSIEEVIQLLKSFSVFQKWQSSNMMLVVKTSHKEMLEEKLATYKFRLQVVLLEDDETAIGAAYAIIQPYTNIHLPAILTAMQQKVAVIVRDSIDLPDLPEYACIKIENEIEQIGQAMIRMYKDEQQRTNLATHAAEWLTQLPVEQHPSHLWKLIHAVR